MPIISLRQAESASPFTSIAFRSIDGADMRVAARSGEEYELLVTAPSLDVAEFSAGSGQPDRDRSGRRERRHAFWTMAGQVDPGTGHDHFST